MGYYYRGFRAAEARVKTEEWDGAGSKRFERTNERRERVHFAHDRACRPGTAGARAHPPELLHSKSSPHKRAKWRHISASEENFGFWIDDEAKTLTFLDNTPLIVTRLDQFWISANRDGIFYEFDRRDGTLSYASSTTKDGVSITIVGSGRCQSSAYSRSGEGVLPYQYKAPGVIFCVR